MTAPTPTRWLSLQDAAVHYGACVKTLRRAINRGDLRAGRCGPRLIRIRVDDLDALFRPIPSARSVGAGEAPPRPPAYRASLPARAGMRFSRAAHIMSSRTRS